MYYWKLGTISLPFHCAAACLFLPPSIIHSKTAMSQKRTDMEQKKEKGRGVEKTRTRWAVAIILMDARRPVLHLRLWQTSWLLSETHKNKFQSFFLIITQANSV